MGLLIRVSSFVFLQIGVLGEVLTSQTEEHLRKSVVHLYRSPRLTNKSVLFI